MSNTAPNKTMKMAMQCRSIIPTNIYAWQFLFSKGQIWKKFQPSIHIRMTPVCIKNCKSKISKTQIIGKNKAK